MSMSLRDITIAAGGVVAGAVLGVVGLGGGSSPAPPPPVGHTISGTPVISPCENGWDFNQTDDHGAVATCSDPSSGWVVVLTKDLTFDYGLNTKDPNAGPVTAPGEVPGWLED